MRATPLEENGGVKRSKSSKEFNKNNKNNKNQ